MDQPRNIDSADADPFEAEVREAARACTRKLLKSGASVQALGQLTSAIWALTSGAVAASRHVHPVSRPLACGAGCSYCCYLHASTSAPEVLIILNHLTANLSAHQLADLKARVDSADAVTHGLDGYGRLIANVPCPLLQGGQCSVYGVRPLVCRGA